MCSERVCEEHLLSKVSHSQLSLMQKKKLWRKNLKSQWTMKYRPRSAGQGVCLKGVPRTITMQGFTLAAFTDKEKTKLRHKN